jgi:hypothetical protein
MMPDAVWSSTLRIMHMLSYMTLTILSSDKHKHSEQVCWQSSTVSRPSRLSTKSSKAATNSSNREHSPRCISAILLLTSNQIHWRIDTDQQNHIGSSTKKGQKPQCEMMTTTFHFLNTFCLSVAAFDTRRIGKPGLPSAWEGLALNEQMQDHRRMVGCFHGVRHRLISVRVLLFFTIIIYFIACILGRYQRAKQGFRASKGACISGTLFVSRVFSVGWPPRMTFFSFINFFVSPISKHPNTRL